MKILSIETSCDETSAAVVQKNDTTYPTILGSALASSSDLHALTGGIIPEQAARAQLEYIFPIISKALLESEGKTFSHTPENYKKGMDILSKSIDAIAVTQGPGLIGSLLIGVESAKALALVYDKPLIPVNHLLAHIYANWITTSDEKETQQIQFPFIGLIVSGGHTDLLLFKNHGDYTWIGGTRDDAAGEALDKIGRLLNLSYPAGPQIEKLSQLAKKKDIKFSRPLKSLETFDFSFSGLKTEAARFIRSQSTLTPELISEICYAVQDAIVDVLVYKTVHAAEKYNCSYIVLGGGVSANQALRDYFQKKASDFNIQVMYPEKQFTTDNASMIGAYAAYNMHSKPLKSIQAKPNLYLV